MALPPSGLDRKEVDLVLIETEELFLYIKGRPYHERYESLKQYKTETQFKEQKMFFACEGEGVQSVEIYDVQLGELVPQGHHPPIFFENGVYQLVVSPKKDKTLSFYHEHPGLRKAVDVIGKGHHQLLMGNLQFTNEVGYTTFEIYDDQKRLLEITLEIFPTKLDYKEDYQKLLTEVNDEIYNLAFHFIRKTFLGATTVISREPSLAEFYRLFQHFYERFFQAIDRIEQQPYHQLMKEHKRVRGDQIKKLDIYGRKFLRKNPELFVEVPGGVLINGKGMLPKNGLTIERSLTFDIFENRFVKWMILRLIDKVEELDRRLRKNNGPFQREVNEELLQKISKMRKRLQGRLKKPFWKQIGLLDRSVMSLVLQMKPGYRDAYMIFLIVSRGLALQGQLTKMSVKDVATLYEYWTYLKMGQILSRKYERITQDIVKVKRDGLFVDLDQSRSAKQVFRHPQTGEKIELYFQKLDKTLPTVSQKPDIMLSIAKNGKDFNFNYVFDAKYRIDFAPEGSSYHTRYKTPGPLEDDINTMHRYRDSLVVQHEELTEYPYERHAFGAYVLFPWNQEEFYEGHRFYQSIEKVNIGGFPFLPNATRLVEQFVEWLVDKSPEEIQKEGILPKGTREFWQSTLEDKVLVGSVKDGYAFEDFIKNRCYTILVNDLKKGWQEAKYVALYVKQEITAQKQSVENGISFYGEIKEVQIKKSNTMDDYIRFDIVAWKMREHPIVPVGYGISSYALTTLSIFEDAKELPELFMKSSEEINLWRMLRRLSNKVKTELNNKIIDTATSVEGFQIKDLQIKIEKKNEKILVLNKRQEVVKEMPLNWLQIQPTTVFKEVLGVYGI